MSKGAQNVTKPTSVAALGIFDGVHLGHQRLLKQATLLAEEIGATPMAVTFDPHPQALLRPELAPKLLQTIASRVRCLHDFGALRVDVISFTPDFAALEPEAFLASICDGQANVAGIVVGVDFRFGRGRSGDTETITNYAKARGIAVRVVDEVMHAGIPVRSTAVRTALAESNLDFVAALLGRHWSLTGSVVRGKQLGRKLGWPTANVAHGNDLAMPMPGVYAGWAEGAFGRRMAAVSIGTNPTVSEGNPVTFEAYLLDFDADIYDTELTVGLIGHIRGTEKFSSLDALKARIAEDVAETRRLMSETVWENVSEHG
jgi:riboflavin kinase/FMN adenylyltransferase